MLRANGRPRTYYRNLPNLPSEEPYRFKKETVQAQQQLQQP
jgi:hypothetical protein